MAEYPSSSGVDRDETLSEEVTGCEENDSMLLHPGLKRPPYKASVAQSIKDSWKPDRGRGRRDKRPLIFLTRGCACGLTVLVIATLVIAVALGYTAGFLVGKSLNKSSEDDGGGSKANNEGKSRPSLSKIEVVNLQQVDAGVVLNEEKYNWGDEVAINGSSTKVSELFKDMLDEKDIRSYLE